MKGDVMSTLRRISVAVLFTVAFGAVSASAGPLPQYELTGFPISPLQMSVVRPSGIHQPSPASALTLDGMPASAHQIAVIRGY